MKIKQKGFTMIELLTVIGIVAVLAIVVVVVINPSQLLMQSRDSNRVGSLSTINSAVALAKSNGLSLGTPNIAYVSIPDPTLTGNQTSTCSSLGLPVLPSTTYQCVSPANVANDNGTGWIPIAFTSLPGGFPLGSLPVDPVNATSSNEYYVYTTNGTGYEVMGNPEAAKDVSGTSFVQGTNQTLVSSFPTLCANTTLGGAGTASGTAPARIVVSWTPTPSAVSYDIFIATTSGGPYTNIGESTSSAFSDSSGLSNGSTYYFVVEPLNAASNIMCQSNQAAITIPNGRGH